MNKFRQIYEFLCGEEAYEEREKELWGSNKLTDKQIGRIAKGLRMTGWEVPDDVPDDYIYKGDNCWHHPTYKPQMLPLQVHNVEPTAALKEMFDNSYMTVKELEQFMKTQDTIKRFVDFFQGDGTWENSKWDAMSNVAPGDCEIGRTLGSLRKGGFQVPSNMDDDYVFEGNDTWHWTPVGDRI